MSVEDKVKNHHAALSGIEGHDVGSVADEFTCVVEATKPPRSTLFHPSSKETGQLRQTSIEEDNGGLMK